MLGADRATETFVLNRHRSRARGRARRRLAAGAVAAVAAVAAVLVLRPGAPAEPARGTAAPVAAYRLTYAVDSDGQPQRRQTISVRRPFHSRETVRDSQGVVSEIVSNDEGQWLFERGRDPAAWLQLGSTPARASADLHVGAVLRFMIERGDNEQRGFERHAGRRCMVVRTGGPVGAVPSAPRDDSYADLCVDDAGLLLAERWYLDGALVQSRTATSVDVAPVFEEDTFAAPGSSSPAPGMRMPMRRADRAGPERFDPPADYRLAGGYVAVSAQTQPRSVWLFVNGGDLIEYEEGPAVSGGSTTEVDGRTVSIALGFGSTSIIVPVDAGDAVILRTSDPGRVEELVARITVDR